MPKDPNTKSVAAPNLGFQKHGYSLSSGILRYSQDRLLNSAKLGLWNWLFEPGPFGVQGNILAPLLTFGEHPRVLSVNCLTQHVERADCSWVPWGDQQLTAPEAVVLEFLARFFRNTSKLFSLEGVSAVRAVMYIDILFFQTRRIWSFHARASRTTENGAADINSLNPYP